MIGGSIVFSFFLSLNLDLYFLKKKKKKKL